MLAETLFGVRNELIVAGILGGFAILASVSAYAAQRWAFRCHAELKRMNELLERALAPRGPSYLDEDTRF